MLTLDELKNLVHREFSQADKALLVIGCLNKPSQIQEIKIYGRDAGLRGIEKWNLSYLLGRTKGLAINTSMGWELSEAGRGRVRTLLTSSPPTRQQILKSADALRNMTHSAFDRMLLEFGIEGINAGREVGSLASRINALAKFSTSNPTEPTAEGTPLGWAIVDYARQLQHETNSGFGQSDSNISHLDIDESSNELGTSKSTEPRMRKDHILGSSSALRKRVFLVHGRDTGALHEVARFLERIGLEVTILHERPNRGRTLISKFEEESAGISYAIVLMTPDDVGGLKGENPSARARQNVVFELGFFIGRLGPSNVCALMGGGVEKPSDFDAVVYIDFNAGGWKAELARELRAAEISFDYSKVF